MTDSTRAIGMRHMDSTVQMSRRRFLVHSAGISGGLLIGMYVPHADAQVHTDVLTEEDGRLNLWLHIDPSNQVTVTIAASEMGQGVYTSLAMLVAEELEVGWQSVKAIMAPAESTFSNTIFGTQATSGSTSIRWTFEPLRHIGATAREMLTEAAARRWNVDAGDCVALNATVTHQATGQVLRYGDLVAAAARLPVPDEVVLKTPEQWTLLGTSAKRLDTPMKIDGSARFGIDVQMPDLLIATVASCPTVGGTLVSVDDTPALSISGVKRVLSLGNAVVVVGTGYWPVSKALARLSPIWDPGASQGRDTDHYRRELQTALDSPGTVAHNAGDIAPVLAGASTVIEATYEVPHLAHATMEPMNATAWVREDRVDIWAPTQVPGIVQQVAAELLGVAPATVSVHTLFLGGGFGRRFEVDFVMQAVLTSRMMGQAVKLIWSREEDTRHDFYRPAAMSRFKAVLGDDGYPTAWHNRIASPSILERLFPDRVEDGVDAHSVEGARELPFNVPNQRIETQIVDTGLPVGFWRSVGHSQNAFFVQSFLDELAVTAGIDPLKYQINLLDSHKRHQAVLSAAAAIAQWPKRSAERPMGLAVHASVGSYCALVVQLDPNVDEAIRVRRISAAIDCGRAINPDTVVAQIESAIVYGLTAAFYG
ncbi:MAG: xanthine dehydrogenase family protein molybdopterin-binding subunit, partial [Granulosicoccus sp.]|nr:xanthine dehydrogenase family protein molybdopterin-binding subunit [Granulosicoccus sp.]